MGISIRQMTDMDYNIASNLLNFEDAEAELVEAFENRINMYSILNGNDLAGVAQVKERNNAYLNLFIDTPYRCNGIGDTALNLCEHILRDVRAYDISTSYRLDNDTSKSFAEKHGYTRSFSSAYMEYSGNLFDIPDLPIRVYNDDDYESAHEMYARAFHEMRIKVGDFPDSIIELPTDSMRKHWALTKKERFVYVQDSEIIGYAHVVDNEIGSISVKSQYQGQGIGRMFMKFIANKILEDGHKTVSLYCVVGNRAKRLYDSLGFTDVYIVEHAKKSLH